MQYLPYSMKALQVKGIKPEVAVYQSTEDSPSESAVVQTRMGNGYVGYVGDVNYEGGSSRVILAMLGLSDGPLQSSTPQTNLPELEPVAANEKGTNDNVKSDLKTNRGFVMLLSVENEDRIGSRRATPLYSCKNTVETSAYVFICG